MVQTIEYAGAQKLGQSQNKISNTSRAEKNLGFSCNQTSDKDQTSQLGTGITCVQTGMGLLSEGSPLSWEETKKHADHVRKHGILQFINIYNKLKDRANDCLRWGDEVRLQNFYSRLFNCYQKEQFYFDFITISSGVTEDKQT